MMDAKELTMRGFEIAAKIYRLEGNTEMADDCDRIAWRIANKIQSEDLAEIEARA